MALPANALTLTLSDASTKIVYVRFQTFNWTNGRTSVQWAEIVTSGQTYIRNPANPTDTIADIAATNAASIAYMTSTQASQLSQLNTFLTAYYNAIIAAATGTFTL